MAPIQRSFSSLELSCLLFAIFSLTPLITALPHPKVQKRDFLSDIGNFFDSLEMQVDMTIFQPIANFFVETTAEIESAAIAAEGFFMQGNEIVVSALYDIEMLVVDVNNAVEKDIIDAVTSVENLAVKISRTVNSDINTVTSDITNEFNYVITPALTQVGLEIGQGLTVAGADILEGLTVAGQYIEDHPELVAETFLTVAISAASVIQPEFIGLDGALIGEVATEVAADAAGDVLGGLASDAVMEGAGVILDDGTEEVVSEADMTLFEQISTSLDKYTGYYDNINKILNLANDVNSTLADVADIFPVTAQTIGYLTNIVGPLANATQPTVEIYGKFVEVLDYLNEAGKIIAVVARDVPVLEERKATTSKTKTHNTMQTSTRVVSTATSTSTKSSITSSVTSAKSTSTATGTKTASSTASASPLTASDIPLPVLTQWVQHHWLNQTMGGKTYVKQMLKTSFMNTLGSGNMTKTGLKTSPQLITAITKMNSGLTYPPSTASYNQAISHQIATGNATAYNGKNVTVVVEMNPNAPKDVCLGLPKLSCFGNQLGQPYCLNDCASRWYNQMNVQVQHF